MAFSIIVYEKDFRIFDLISQRLKVRFNDAYIFNEIDMTSRMKQNDLSEFSKVIYDNHQFENKNSLWIPIYSDEGIIDINKICSSLILPSELNATNNVDGELIVILPFTSIDFREATIKKLSDKLFESDFNLRIDLLSAYRSSTTSNIKSGSLTPLINKSIKDDFEPADIFKYCGYDRDGFMNPGPALNPDDIYNLNPNVIEDFVKKIKELTKSNSNQINALIVYETYKEQDILRIVPYASKVLILLPSSNSQESLQMTELIAKIARCTQGNDIEILYQDKPEIRNEEIV